MLNEFLFTKIVEEDISNIQFQQDASTRHTAEATLYDFHTVFEDHIISRRADVVCQTMICGVPSKTNVTPTIDALTDNIREAIGKIQLHTIDNMLKNWTVREGTAWPAEPAI